jgi:hypothetical protein
VTTRFAYDAANRKIAEFAPDTTPADSLDNPADSTWYDPAGNVIKTRNRLGESVTFQYDTLKAIERTKKLWQARGCSEKFHLLAPREGTNIIVTTGSFLKPSARFHLERAQWRAPNRRSLTLTAAWRTVRIPR